MSQNIHGYRYGSICRLIKYTDKDIKIMIMVIYVGSIIQYALVEYTQMNKIDG